jgi:hypothetical protein
MEITVNFTKPVPDELYIDSFTKGNTQTWTYTGNNLVYISVDKISNGIQGVHDTLEFNYNPDLTEVMTIDAPVHPDIAYYASNTHIPDRIFVTETLIDGTTYEQITNPVLRDIYEVRYDSANTAWNWIVITRNPKSLLNDYADRNKHYINNNISKISSNAALMEIANTYLQTLETFETTGKGSIPSWKMITTNLGDVPPIPHDLIVAFNVLP